MSRVVTLTSQVRDGKALLAACRHLNLAEPVLGAYPLFSEVASGFAVRLPGWKYPAVFQLDTGLVKFDSSDGLSGEQTELDKLLEAYSLEIAAVEARRKGCQVGKRQLQDSVWRHCSKVLECNARLPARSCGSRPHPWPTRRRCPAE